MPRTPMLLALAALLALPSALPAHAVQTQAVAYEHDGVALEGFLAYDDQRPQHKGAVLIVHEWWGLNDYAKGRAKQLAELGYMAFAVDMYGPGKVTGDAEQASRWAGQLYGDRALLRGRVIAGLHAFREAAGLEAEAPVVAIGYCFGGTTVTELAYAGQPGVAGVVSFHGNPKPPAEDDKVTASLLICHGDADPLVPDEDLDKVTAALDAKDADWLLVRYADAKHSFTNPAADKVGMDAVGYDEKAAARAWRHMLAFFDELLGASDA